MPTHPASPPRTSVQEFPAHLEFRIAPMGFGYYPMCGLLYLFVRGVLWVDLAQRQRMGVVHGVWQSSPPGDAGAPALPPDPMTAALVGWVCLAAVTFACAWVVNNILALIWSRQLIQLSSSAISIETEFLGK